MPCGNIVGHQRGHPDAQVDVKPIAQFLRDSPRDSFPFLFSVSGMPVPVDSLSYGKSKNRSKTGHYNFRTVRFSTRFS